MTKIAHSNFFAHRMLTDQGAYVHCHEPETFEDVGDAESGPQLTGGPSYDRYSGESHEFIIDEKGLIVHCSEIDWGVVAYFSQWIDEPDATVQEPAYFRKRMSGEDWQVHMTDEDGKWYACWGGIGWTDDRAEDVGFFPLTRASQIAHDFNRRNHGRHDVGPAKLKAVAPGIHHYKGFAVQCRYWTRAELVRFNVGQKPGFYWDEVDDETGEAACQPRGPYATELEAYAGWRVMADKVI